MIISPLRFFKDDIDIILCTFSVGVLFFKLFFSSNCFYHKPLQRCVLFAIFKTFHTFVTSSLPHPPLSASSMFVPLLSSTRLFHRLLSILLSLTATYLLLSTG